MRGADTFSEQPFTLKKLDDFVPAKHPLRVIRSMVNEALAGMNDLFAQMYADDIKGGRPSIAPEKLLRGMLLQVLYSIRSERQLMEQIEYNLLFRWFIGLSMDDAVWVPTVFTKNRQRLIEHDAVVAFFNEVLKQADKKKWLSKEHFSVDGTLIQAWAGHKSFVRKDDKGDDAAEFIEALQEMKVTPHVAQNKSNRASAVPEEIAATDGYRISQQKRKLIEQGFGWAKFIGPIRQVMVRGIKKVDQVFVLAMATYKLVRMRTLGQVRLQYAP